MDYNLDSLGSRNFEHVTQALAVRAIGPLVSVFGDGPDAGREGTWNGPAVSLGSSANWDGYGVIQAKYRTHPGDVADNLKWLQAEITKELREWARAESKRRIKPAYILFATNVRLSATAGGGKDSIKSTIDDVVSELALPISDYRVWDAEDLRTLLDDADSIRKRYTAFLTPGDVVARLVEEQQWGDDAFRDAIYTHAGRSFRDDNMLNLTQAGTVSDQRISVSDVFVDLPSAPSLHRWTSDMEAGAAAVDLSDGIAAHLISAFDDVAVVTTSEEAGGTGKAHKAVIIGGPGQGKSTITQWLAQVYRAEFLRGSPIANTTELTAPLSGLYGRLTVLDMAAPSTRRWPFRVILTELADYLAKEESGSLLQFITQRISARSSTPIAVGQLRKWLAAYPWILLIDGLDEVPNSSNREQVMSVISDFFIDVAQLGADVACLATTRPQGYGDEFSPSSYFHYTLLPLSPAKAIAYAEGLVALRAGADTPAANKVMDRLRRALSEESTTRFFESPLQVTILTVLLERLGKAPRDRWRLFSEYYRVISQREQEKGGELAELLQKYESDVDHIHRHIGELLQTRSSGVGETTASISRQEFDELIEARLREQGHDELEIERLTSDFSRLVTDRLVFLALLTSDRVGFELRSLQEFMAGENVVQLPEHAVMPRLQEIALSVFWRNVVLFAIGCIFATKEHLRAEVLVLCTNLDVGDPVDAVLRPGSELALDILIDGSCQSQPRYARALAAKASQIMTGPPNSRAYALGQLRDSDSGDVPRTEAESTASASDGTWINRAVVLAALEPRTGEERDPALRRLVDAAEPDLVAALIELALRTPLPGLVWAVEKQVSQSSPFLIFKRRPDDEHHLSEYRSGDPQLPEWYRHVAALNSELRSRPPKAIGIMPDRDSDPLRYHIVETGQHEAAWTWAADLPSNHPGWQALASLARFALAPSADSLGDTLEAMATSSWPERAYVRRAPWIVEACLTNSADFAAAFGLGQNGRLERLRHLASLARTGVLGSEADWAAAEERWSLGFTPDDLFVEVPREMDGDNSWDLPVWPGLAERGVPLSGGAFVFHEISTQSQCDAVVNLIGQILLRDRHLQAGSEKLSLRSLAAFLTSLIVEEVTEAEVSVSLDAKKRATMYSWLRDCALDEQQQIEGWVAWVGLGDSQELLRDNGALPRKLGEVSRIFRRELPGMGDALWLAAAACGNDTSIYRLALHFHPALAMRLPALLCDLPHTSGRASKVSALGRILAASTTEIHGGGIDDDLRAFCVDEHDSLGSDWLAPFLMGHPDGRGLDLATRVVTLIGDERPFEAGKFLEFARMMRRQREAMG